MTAQFLATTPSWFLAVMVALFMGWSGLLVGIIAWLLNRHWHQLDHRLTSIEAAHNEHRAMTEGGLRELENRLNELRVELARDYVRHETWFVGQSKIEGLLQRLYMRLPRQQKGG